MRGFRCIPTSLTYAQALTSLTSFERDFLFSALLAQDDRHTLPHDPATLRSVIWPTRPFTGLREISLVRDKLIAAGVLVSHQSPRKQWLEIAPEYRHTEGRNETSFGDETPAASQMEMPLGPVPLRKSNRLRAESEKKRTDPESAREPLSVVPFAPEPPQESGNQELLARKGKAGEQRFAQDASAVPHDPLWSSLCVILGSEIMKREGDLWLKRYRLCRDALATAVRDYRSLTPERRKEFPPERYLTAAFENEKRKFA